MSRWIMCLAAGLLVLVTSCSSAQTNQPSAVTATAEISPTTTPAVAAATLPATATVAAQAAATEAPKPTDLPATPVATPASTAVATSAANSIGGQTAGNEFLPKVRSVWNTTVGQDQMAGTCPKGSMLPVYGLVQITPNGDKIAWKNQEPAPYTFTRLQPNVYQYAGPTAIKDGVVTMTVTFVSDKAFTMDRMFVATADPGCTHVHEYTGEFQWLKP